MRRWWKWLMLLALLAWPAIAHGQSGRTNRAGLVVQFGDGTVLTRCVEFSEPDIRGDELLSRAGLDISAEYIGMGVAVCRVEGVGCRYPAEACFCQCEGAPCNYWVYHHLMGGAWQYSGFGADTYHVRDGDVEGWAWGEGSPRGGLQPPLFTFEQICSPAEPTVSEGSVVEPAAADPGSPSSHAAQPNSTAGSPVGYAVFGALVVGLIGVLLIAGARREG